MADTKMSDFPATLSVASGDYFPILQGGVNKKAWRSVILVAVAGEHIQLVGNGTNYSRIVSADLLNYVTVHQGTGIDVLSQTYVKIQTGVAGSILDMKTTGDISITLPAGKIFDVGDLLGAARIVVDRTLNQVSILSTVQPFVTYVPLVPANWALPVPIDIATAIDRLVAAVVARTVGGPV